MKTGQPRPAVALDVDGVVRVIPRLERDELGRPLGERPPLNADVAEITIPEGGELVTPFHYSEAGTFPIYLARGVGPWVLSLLDRGVEVVWATTWMSHANVHIAPLLGIPELPVAVRIDEYTHFHRGDSAAWKLDHLAQGFRGRPLVWIDDNPPWHGGVRALADARAHTRRGSEPHGRPECLHRLDANSYGPRRRLARIGEHAGRASAGARGASAAPAERALRAAEAAPPGASHGR